MSLKDSIGTYMDAGYPILYIDTFEEEKIEEIVKSAAVNQKIGVWSKAGGFYQDGECISQCEDISGLLTVLKDDLLGNTDMRFLLIIKDAHIALENEDIKMALKELAIKFRGKHFRHIVLISPSVKIPIELEKYVIILEDNYLNTDEICDIVQKFVQKNNMQELEKKFLSRFANALKGLSEYEILNFLSLATVKDHQLTESDLSLISEQKQQMILKSGTLEMISNEGSIDDIGGLENLKEWLGKKEKIMKDIPAAQEFGVDMPKGVLIAGIPGCGKSLCAKATATLFDVPLLRLDIGKLMGKYLGESEANLRKAIKLAEAISPCVLWVDELEKAFAGAGSNAGHEVTTRLFGSFLTWMQEKTSPVFVVATANNIKELPPELLRKGRFDEIFYVGLPDENEREKIFEIHINKRRENAKIDTEKLASKTDGYSGADIEGVVREAVESTFANNEEELSTDDILEAINHTNSLSVIMKDSIDEMKKEYTARKLKNASR